jgi:hypothetical protein
MIPNTNPAKKHLQKLLTKIPRKSSEIAEKEKRDEQQEHMRNHAKPSIHTTKDSYKV